MYNVQVECEENCGNSPKKELLKNFTIAYVRKDIEFVLEWIREDVVWEIIGNQKIQGIDMFEKALQENKDIQIEKLQIHNIITHGNTASVNGTLTLNSQKKISFCDVYQFGGFGKKAKIKEITSYIIPHKY